MTGLKGNIGPLSRRRRAAAIVALVGILFVGARLARAWPREVAIAYEVGPAVAELHVDYLQEGVAVASARFRGTTRNAGIFQHTVRLRPGAYRVHITLYGRGHTAVEEVRSLSVPSGGITRIDLTNTFTESE
jgi:hypothetical protein